MPGLSMETLVSPTVAIRRTRSRTVAVPVPQTRAEQLVTDLRTPFSAFVRLSISITDTSSSLAPKLMSAFDAWQAETGGSFIAFVRLLDPSVPEDRDGYRAHRAYQAADYLRRITKPPTEAQPIAQNGDRPVPPLEAFTRLLAVIAPLVPQAQQPRLWGALSTELHWSPMQIEKVRAHLGEVHKLFTTKPVAIRLLSAGGNGASAEEA